MDDLWTVVKKLAFLIAVLACLILLMKSFFNMGRVAIFGVPVSGLLLAVILRNLWNKLE